VYEKCLSYIGTEGYGATGAIFRAVVMVRHDRHDFRRLWLVYDEIVKMVLFGLLLLGAFRGYAAEPVTDEYTRLLVLRQIFPTALIVKSSALTENSFYRSEWLKELRMNDAMKAEPVYYITRSVSKDEEDAASDVAEPDKKLSETRCVRLRLFRWRSGNTKAQLLIAVLAYRFIDANPPNCCQSIGKLVALSADARHVLDSFVNMPHAFTMFTSIMFLDADQSGSEKLVTERDFSSPGEVGKSLMVFDLNGLTLKPQLQIAAASSWPEKYILALDEQATMHEKGRRYCFVRTSYAREGKTFPKPVITRISYQVGSGL
jgi:hypothetical protein